jgi:hypothetical protein
MSAKLQLEKEIREAVVFLREKNQTIPSDTIEFMKIASLEKLNSLPDIEPKTIILCADCNSDNVLIKNLKKMKGLCVDCTGEHNLYATILKAEAKVIGFQVVGTANTDKEGDIHPDMLSSSALYSLKQAREMIKDRETENWGLLTIWSGDIEEPQYMFLGNPRQNIICPDEDILQILLDKRNGEDCTEEDSAEIKGYLRELKLPEEQPLVAEIQELFPQEYGEYLTEEESGAPENFSDLEVEEYLAQWGQSHREITSNLGLRPSHADSDEILMEDYFYLEGKKKWYPKSASTYTPREQKIVEYIRNDRDNY